MTEDKNTDNSSANSSAESTSESNVTPSTSAKKTKSVARKTDSSHLPHELSPNNASKSGKVLASIAILFSLLAIAGSGALFWWLMQQQPKQAQMNTRQIEQQVNQAATTLSAQLEQQAELVSQQLSHANNQASAQVEQLQQTITQLSQQVARLESRKPSEWILHEVEYLIRVAGRAMWLERDTTAAIALLKDANQRLQELNDPQFIAVRKLIHQDIEALSLIPKIDIENIVLSVMALEEQIAQLPIAMANIPDSAEPEPTFELTHDTADWKENLQKTWDKFLADFITIRRRTGHVEPLMSPQFQQNLRENLSLKLQQVQFALTKQHTKLYQASLHDIHRWVTEHFDHASPVVSAFIERVGALQQESIEVVLPNKLHSLEAILALSESAQYHIPEVSIDTRQNEEVQQENQLAPTNTDEGKAEEDLPENETPIEVDPPKSAPVLPESSKQDNKQLSAQFFLASNLGAQV